MGEGNICPKPSGFSLNPELSHEGSSWDWDGDEPEVDDVEVEGLGVAMRSRFQRMEEGMRGPRRYSVVGLRGGERLGMCQETSRILVVA